MRNMAFLDRMFVHAELFALHAISEFSQRKWLEDNDDDEVTGEKPEMNSISGRNSDEMTADWD